MAGSRVCSNLKRVDLAVELLPHGIGASIALNQISPVWGAADFREGRTKMTAKIAKTTQRLRSAKKVEPTKPPATDYFLRLPDSR